MQICATDAGSVSSFFCYFFLLYLSNLVEDGCFLLLSWAPQRRREVLQSSLGLEELRRSRGRKEGKGTICSPLIAEKVSHSLSLSPLFFFFFTTKPCLATSSSSSSTTSTTSSTSTPDACTSAPPPRGMFPKPNKHNLNPSSTWTFDKRATSLYKCNIEFLRMTGTFWDWRVKESCQI